MKRLVVILLALPALAQEPVTPLPGTADAFRQFANVLDVLQKHFLDVEALDLNAHSTAAFRQFVRSIDPEADLLTAAEVAVYKTPGEGDVGLALAARADAIVVVSARDGSPAQRAGFHTGDRIVTNARLAVVRAMLRGPVGEPVTLGKITMVRAALTNVPPTSLQFHKAGIASCRLAEFSEPARQRLEFDLTRAVKEHARGLVLDIRNNAGGALDPMLHIARLFLPDDAEIVALEFARPEQRVVFRSDASPKFTAPVVLLVNGGTAAEAEAFAAALRDNGRARLVGSRTSGRGKNYGLFELPDGNALYIPTSRYMPPSKQSFSERGVTPDQMAADDAALARALELLSKSGSLRSDESKTGH